MRTNTFKYEHRERLMPLYMKLRERLSNKLLQDVAEDTHLPIWQVSRILNASTASPTYVDLVRIIDYAGMSQDEAARIAGLVRQREAVDELTERIEGLMSDPELTQEMRERAFFLLETYISGEKTRLSSETTVGTAAKTVGERPIKKVRSRARSAS